MFRGPPGTGVIENWGFQGANRFMDRIEGGGLCLASIYPLLLFYTSLPFVSSWMKINFSLHTLCLAKKKNYNKTGRNNINITFLW